MKLEKSKITDWIDLELSWQKGLPFFFTAISCVFLAILSMTTVYSSDDYWYSTFMDGSIEEYVSMMKEHYLTFNGRVFVHFIAQFILHFGNVLFTLFTISISVLIPAAAYKIRRPAEENGDDLFISVLLFVMGVLILPRAVIVNGFLWISGFCNYALPTAMVVLEILLLQNFCSEKERRLQKRDFLTCLYVFLCAATTEQMGIAAVLMSLFFLLHCLLHNRKRTAACLLASTGGVLGLLSIFLSPATRARVQTETLEDEASFFVHMKTQLAGQAELLGEYTSVLLWLAVLFICTGGLLIFRKRKVIAGLGMACIPVCLLFLLYFSRGISPLLPYAGILCFLLVQAAAYQRMGYNGLSLLQIAALGSVGVMLLTGSTGHRIFLPFCLCILAVLSQVLAELLKNVRTAVCMGILILMSCLSFASISVQMPGYLHNYEVDFRNRLDAAQARRTGVHYYCVDYDEEYTHIKAYDRGYFYNSYLKSEGLNSETVKVYFYSEKLPAVYVGSERAASPALPGKEGEWLLPLRNIIETLGGSIELPEGWTDRMEITLDGRVYYYSAKDTTAVLCWKDDSGEKHRVEGSVSRDFFAVCLSEKIYQEAFDLKVICQDDRIDVVRKDV